MTEQMSYPTNDMSSTSRSLRSFLDEQWNQHTTLFMSHQDSYSALLQAVAKIIPNAGNKAQELTSSLQDYHQQYQNCYQALRQLAETIDTSAQTMSNIDQQIGRGFGREAETIDTSAQTMSNPNQQTRRGFGRD